MKLQEIIPNNASDQIKIKNLYQFSNQVLFDEVVEDESRPVIKRKTPQEAIKDFKEKYPEKERWRLFVDGRQYAKQPVTSYYPFENIGSKIFLNNKVAEKLHLDPLQTYSLPFIDEDVGWLRYEKNEPNSVTACLHALNYALSQLGQIRDEPAFIKEVHKRVLKNVKLSHGFEVTPGHYKTNLIATAKIESNMVFTKEGITDLLTKIADGTLVGAYIEAKDATNAVIETIRKSDAHFGDNLALLTAELTDLKSGQLKFTKETLNKIKSINPEFYDQFTNKLSASILEIGEGRFYSCFSFYAEKIGNLNLQFWEQMHLSEKHKTIAEIIFPGLNSSAKNTQLILSNFTSSEVLQLAAMIENEIFENKTFTSPDGEFFKLLINKIDQRISKISTRMTHIAFNDKLEALKEKNIECVLNDEILKACQQRIAFLMLRHCVIKIGYSVLNNKIDKAVQQIFDSYRSEIASLTLSDDDRLNIIAKTIESFQRNHPFDDANGRVFVNIQLNLLLLENGFPPATFFQPNLFDGFHDLLGAIKRGICNTLEIYKCIEAGKEVDLYGVKTDSIDKQLMDDSIKNANEDLRKLTMYDIVKQSQKLTLLDVDLLAKGKNSFGMFSQTEKKDEGNKDTKPPVGFDPNP